MSTSLIEFTTWGFGMQFQQHMWYMGNQLVVSVPGTDLRISKFLSFFLSSRLLLFHFYSITITHSGSASCTGSLSRSHRRSRRLPKIHLGRDVRGNIANGFPVRLRQSTTIRINRLRSRGRQLAPHPTDYRYRGFRF